MNIWSEGTAQTLVPNVYFWDGISETRPRWICKFWVPSFQFKLRQGTTTKTRNCITWELSPFIQFKKTCECLGLKLHSSQRQNRGNRGRKESKKKRRNHDNSSQTRFHEQQQPLVLWPSPWQLKQTLLLREWLKGHVRSLLKTSSTLGLKLLSCPSAGFP